ncbi:expressed unknown protein [Seminavis robusta]|uniref:Uncharacterized protein n=1 Tax=Seminavis robusta TaxID=568900 RepID=A0A9N8DGP2_9STRA|nr:expressed unknown protein [Seminavis robusta]|eukprot:Sro133_g063140.1 n/a (112) ;mRNA; f:81738-82073
MTSSLSFVLLVALCLFSVGSALQVPKIQQNTRVSSMPRCFLHPDQAAELEQCALDLTKAFVEEQRKKGSTMAFEYNSPVDPDTMQRTLPSPVAWCRRRLWPFTVKGKGLSP